MTHESSPPAKVALTEELGGITPRWKPAKDALDAIDDWHGPYNEWAFDLDEHRERKQALWCEFLAWATDHLGQGYSLACNDGCIIDPVTFWAFKAFLVGRGVYR